MTATRRNAPFRFCRRSTRQRSWQFATSLVRAQELRAETRPDLLLGGVAIPERHTRRGEEHLRLIAKQKAGCSFFVTQVVYDVNAAKDLVSDYRYECAALGLQPVPIVFTFSVCGSMKTLEFLQWLGVDVPRWIQNDLRHADDTLQESYDQALATACELVGFCRRVDVPFGINVESARGSEFLLFAVTPPRHGLRHPEGGETPEQVLDEEEPEVWDQVESERDADILAES